MAESCGFLAVLSKIWQKMNVTQIRWKLCSRGSLGRRIRICPWFCKIFVRFCGKPLKNFLYFFRWKKLGSPKTWPYIDSTPKITPENLFLANLDGNYFLSFWRAEHPCFWEVYWANMLSITALQHIIRKLMNSSNRIRMTKMARIVVMTVAGPKTPLHKKVYVFPTMRVCPRPYFFGYNWVQTVRKKRENMMHMVSGLLWGVPEELHAKNPYFGTFKKTTFWRF